jgi:environmental stress-induced protein Ves
VLAEGSGFVLRSADTTIRVDARHPIASFSGDLVLSCTLPAGPVWALNLIVDRVRLRPFAEILDLTNSAMRREGVVVCLAGRIRVDGVVLDRFDAALIERGEIVAEGAADRAAFLAVLPVQ